MADINKVPPNEYSRTWFEVFLESIQPVQTESEIEFLTRNLPNPPYLNVLDVCCGHGRHTQRLAARGYSVLGIDLNEAALDKAKKILHSNVAYRKHDMRHINQIPESFDAVVNLWQSFGYFDEATNTDILCQISEKLNPKGRLILDIYHRQFFEDHQGTRQFERNGLVITESKTMNGKRLIVDLNYVGHESDHFEWQLYTPDEIIRLAKAFGFTLLLMCSGFDEELPASPDSPRMQMVFEKNDY